MVVFLLNYVDKLGGLLPLLRGQDLLLAPYVFAELFVKP